MGWAAAIPPPAIFSRAIDQMLATLPQVPRQGADEGVCTRARRPVRNLSCTAGARTNSLQRCIFTNIESYDTM